MRFGLAFPGREAARAELHAPARGRLVDHAVLGTGAATDLFVEGDNLDALKLLAAEHRGSVSMIYIDPPYNRGKDFVYRAIYAAPAGARDDDPRAGDARRSGPWLAMMWPRLCLLRELLRDDGLVFVSIDDSEVHHLRALLDEVFGRENFIAQIVVVSNRGGRDYLKIAITHEYVLCYGRSSRARVRELPREDLAGRIDDGRGGYELRELRNRNPRFGPHNRPNLDYPIYADPRVVDAHGCHPVTLVAGAGLVRIDPRNREGGGSVWRWGQPKLRAAVVAGDPGASDVVARRRRDGGYNVYEKYRRTTTKPRALWDDPGLRSEQGSIEIRALLGAALFDHPKPIELVRRCIEIGCDRDGLVLDAFAGSGTTALAVWAQNRRDGGTRRVILVQRPEPIPSSSLAAGRGLSSVADIARARLAAAIDAGQGGAMRCVRVVDNWPGCPPIGAIAPRSSSPRRALRTPTRR